MGKHDDPSPAEQVEVEFRAVIAAVVLHNDQVSAKVGISASESQTLHLLELRGPLTPSELSRLTGLSSGTMTGVLDRLEALGFAHRERHPVDRRKVVVTPDHARMWAVLAPHYADEAEHLAAVIARYSPEQLTLVADFLRQVVGTPSDPAE